jgi:hypothetical protein
VHAQPFGDFSTGEPPNFAMAIAPQKNLRMPDLLGRSVAVASDRIALFGCQPYEILIGSRNCRLWASCLNCLPPNSRHYNEDPLFWHRSTTTWICQDILPLPS